MNNYEDIFSEAEAATAPFSVFGRIKRDAFKQNLAKYSPAGWRQQIDEGAQLWELPYHEDDFTEDNDTSDEDEDEEDLSPASLAGSLVNPKKGFKFFIEQEKKVLAALEKKKLQ